MWSSCYDALDKSKAPSSAHLLVAAGLMAQPTAAWHLTVVPPISSEGYPNPTSVSDDTEVVISRPSVGPHIRVIKTAFDPELDINKKVEYKKMDKRDRYFFTQKERRLAEQASTPTSLDELEKEVGLS